MTNEIDYIAPELYLVAVEVERGYQNSLEDPFEKDEIIW